ncbi:MAG: hypothetical protein RL757_1225 [Bacteroidota bacterium]
MEILDQIRVELQPFDAQLIAVSKTKPVSDLSTLYAHGQRIFGENYVQELVEKQAVLPSDIRWHFIGHLQRNKVKYIASFVDTIHAVDSVELLEEIEKQAAKHKRNINILLQFHIAQEESKFGLSTDLTKNEALNVISERQKTLAHVQIVGVMGMATFSDDKSLVENEFKSLKNIFNILKKTIFADNSSFKEISMGMSDDFKIALREGATMVRIGSLLFGKR